MKLPTPPNWLLALICFVAAVLLMYAYSRLTGLLYVPAP